MRKSKLWLCGIVTGDRKMLENSILHIIDYFDGLIFVVDSRAKNEDIEWLNSIKKEGRIIVKKWVNDHSHSSNEVLFSSVMDFPDYFVWIDQSDRLNETFTKELRQNIEYWHKNDVGAVWIDHPLVIRYHDGVRFVGSPHWTAINIIGQSINLSAINGFRKESYVLNTRDTLKSGFLSPIKYTFEYPAFSNHFQLLYLQFSEEIHKKHEINRIKFRLSCKRQLGIDLTVEGLKSYMQNNVGNYPDWFEKMIEDEVNIKDAFRLFVLKQDWRALADVRFDWSYFIWKATGEINQPKNGEYIGLFNQYRAAKGLERE